jgi:hypothetical protein
MRPRTRCPFARLAGPGSPLTVWVCPPKACVEASGRRHTGLKADSLGFEPTNFETVGTPHLRRNRGNAKVAYSAGYSCFTMAAVLQLGMTGGLSLGGSDG